jgi:predicted dehydrogenase/dTDP-4-dehydrorhamnose reductase
MEKRMTVNSKIKFGVLGCSRVALKGMLPAMLDSELAELEMVGSRDPAKAKEVGTRFGAKRWGTYENVLGDDNIQAVYVSLPNALHEEWTIKALEAGKHVICEKPTAVSYGAARRMVEAAKKNNVRLLEGLMFRYHPQHAMVKELIKKGELGDIIRFDGCFGYAMPDRTSNAMSKELGGGSFNDQIPYPVYSSRMLFGEEPESVLAKIEFDAESGVSVKTDITLNYPGGKTAFASSVFGSYYQSTYDLLGTKANVRMGRAYAVPRDMGTKIYFEADDKVREIDVKPADQFRLMLDDFCLEISDSRHAKNYEEDLLAQAKVLEAARISARENRIVRLDEVSEPERDIRMVVRSLPQLKNGKILLTGASGNLGQAIVRSKIFPNLLSPTHGEMDITDKEAIVRFFAKERPDVVIHAGALVRMAECEKNPRLAAATNIAGTENLAEEILKNETEGKHVRFIYISTDGVYAGTKGNYSENDETIPYNVYGWTKLGGECAVHALPNFCIIRTSFFDPNHIPFETSATDMYSSKMPIDELPSAIAAILASDFIGTVNVGGEKKSHYERYREFKPSIRACTFEDVSKDLHFKVARDASLDLSLWNEIKNQLKK